MAVEQTVGEVYRERQAEFWRKAGPLSYEAKLELVKVLHSKQVDRNGKSVAMVALLKVLSLPERR